MIMAHRTIRNPLISDKKLLDDVMYEVDWEGNILWKWSVSDRFEEFGFDEAAKNILFRNPNMRSSDVALCVATDDGEDLSAREKVFTVDTNFFTSMDRNRFHDEVLSEKEKPVLILFCAERCTHCKALHPVLEEALKEEFRDAYKVAAIPVVAVFKDGNEIIRFNGEKDYDDVCDFLERPITSMV